MITRSLAVLVFAAGASLLVGGLALLGRAPGLPPDTRHLRRMKDRAVAPASYLPYATADFEALPHRAPDAGTRALEARGVMMQGWVQHMLLSGDGDVHLELAERYRGPNDRDTAYVVAEVTPPWRARGRAWSFDSLALAFRPNGGTATGWAAGPRRVRLSGWLLYDHPYDRVPSSWMLANKAPRVTGWEMHPVTRIEWWDDAAGAWRELVP